MSFSFDTKNELCRLPVQRLCCARAEAYGILLYCNTFHSAEVRIVTENRTVADVKANASTANSNKGVGVGIAINVVNVKKFSVETPDIVIKVNPVF